MTGRASGKVILLGEHAVVYGVPALACGIERGARAEARPAAGARSTLSLGGAVTEAGGDEPLSRAFSALLDASLAGPDLDVEASSDLPAGAGLGSSAALSVAIARAVAEARGEQPSDDDIERRALQWERVFHGNPSGVDTAVAARGGFIYFVRGEAPLRVVPRVPITLAIGHSGSVASTREMVEGLARLKARRPDVVDRALEGVRSLVNNARRCVEAGDLVGLGKLLDLNQMLLAGLFLSTEPIEALCSIAREAGALGAKLTGSGGGGCVIALVERDPGPVLEAWQKAGFSGFAAKVSTT